MAGDSRVVWHPAHIARTRLGCAPAASVAVALCRRARRLASSSSPSSLTEWTMLAPRAASSSGEPGSPRQATANGSHIRSDSASGARRQNRGGRPRHLPRGSPAHGCQSSVTDERSERDTVPAPGRAHAGGRRPGRFGPTGISTPKRVGKIGDPAERAAAVPGDDAVSGDDATASDAVWHAIGDEGPSRGVGGQTVTTRHEALRFRCRDRPRSPHHRKPPYTQPGCGGRPAAESQTRERKNTSETPHRGS